MGPSSPWASALLGAALFGATVASVVTLAWSGSFPAPAGAGPFDGVLAEARGWSGATLAVAVPIGIWASYHRESLRGRLAGAGAAAYLLYTYLELAVSPPFSALYLVYVATFACASWALVAFASSVDADELAGRAERRAPRRTIATWAALVGVGLAAAWSKGIFAQTRVGDFGYPVGAAAVGHVVHALDLGLQVPLALATAALLWQRRATGWVVAAVFLVQSTCMSAALVAMVGTSLVQQGDSPVGAAPFAILFLVGAALAGWLFGSVGDERRIPGPAAVRFLDHHRIAFVGLSGRPEDFSRSVAAALTAHGIEVVPVNASAPLFDGHPCATRIGDLADPPQAALLMVPPAASLAVVNDCVAAGVQAIWFHRGIGAGSATPEAVEAARRAGLLVVTDLCPLMLLQPVQGIHRAHGWLRGVPA